MKKGCCRHAQVFHGSPDFSLYEVALIAISPFQIPFSLICAVLSGSYGILSSKGQLTSDPDKTPHFNC